MAFQQEQRAKLQSKRQQDVNLEESSVEKLEEQKQKKQARKRKRQADGDISKGPSTKKTRQEVEKQSSSLVDQEISHSQQSSEISTRKEEKILKSSKVKTNATQHKHKSRAMKDVSNKNQHKKKIADAELELDDQVENNKGVSSENANPLLIFYDCETTGFSIYNDHITDVAAKIVSPPVPVDSPTFTSLVATPHCIPPDGKKHSI